MISSFPLPPEEELHGLTIEEYQKLVAILGRTPNKVELGMVSVMWSEHCSYKSTRVHLKNLPTTAPWVICGPGENAGIIDIGDKDAVIFKMESHNHPSFIDPYQGASTGVGGIMRDIFTMGARPIANLNALRMGSWDHPLTRSITSGVVRGIGGYGNCVGVPTVGGECNFHASYNGNPLVNAMNVGLAHTDHIFYSGTAKVGSPVLYVGAKTGKDGIHGATMASAGFENDEEAEEQRPTVQVGDPFTEKLLIEACLELMQTDVIQSIQDMGAAGLTCSSVEMAAKGGTGIQLNLEKVPMREAHMTPYEIMLSESQERMLMVLHPGKEEEAYRIFTKWGLDCAIIGHITDTQNIILLFHGDIVANMPVLPLTEEAPMYERPYKIPEPYPECVVEIPALSPNDYLTKLLKSPDLCSKRWIYEQYDQNVMNDTLIGSGGDAALVRIHGTKKALALTSDVTPRYCQADPVMGGKQAVAEAWRNIIAVGGHPMAITNCLNFGSPQKEEIMGQLVGCLQGIGEACRALDFPVVSGNVSLYNETENKPILPTPTIGGVGLLKDNSCYATSGFLTEKEEIFVIGETKGHLGASLLYREIASSEEGPPPPVNLDQEKKHGLFILDMIAKKHISHCHDISDGGLYVAIAEMALNGKFGAVLTMPENVEFLFGEDQARYVISLPSTQAAVLQEKAKKENISLIKIGIVGGDSLILNTHNIPVSVLREIHETALPRMMEVA